MDADATRYEARYRLCRLDAAGTAWVDRVRGRVSTDGARFVFRDGNNHPNWCHVGDSYATVGDAARGALALAARRLDEARDAVLAAERVLAAVRERGESCVCVWCDLTGEDGAA